MRRVRLWKGLALVALVALATISVGAQQVPEPMSAARSLALQAQLQKIDQDRAAYVQQFLSQWAPYADSSVYDLWEELGPIAMRAPAWQLYGASLVGDLNTAMRVLSGGEGAGKYINALERPEPKIAAGPAWSAPDALGDTNDQLVYVPIAPCRVVDTRNVGGTRTGILAAGASRDFDLELDALTLAQQGGVASCTGLPNYSYYGWAVNITVVGYSANGWLTAWGYSGTEPNASVINYGSAPYAIANGLILTGCTGCVDDITIRANGGSTHIIIDVVGYFRDAVATAATATRVVGDVQAVLPDNSLFLDGGACPAGTVLIGGEVDHSENDVAVAKTVQLSSTQWRFWMKNNHTANVTVTAYSRCLDSPAVVF